MTRRCVTRNMGCSQSLRKKKNSKDQSEPDSTTTHSNRGGNNGTYDNRLHGNEAATANKGVGSSSNRKPSDPAATSDPESETLLSQSSGEVTARQAAGSSIRSKGGGDAPGGSHQQYLQPNGELQQGVTKQTYREQQDRTIVKVLPKGPIYAQLKVSTSQSDFFRILEEKIERGDDYVGRGNES